MTHSEFVQRRQDRTISAGIHPSTALGLMGYLPKRYQAAHAFWSWIWMLSMPAFLVAAFFVWWVGIPLLLVVTPMIYRATKRSAAQFVLEHAQDNKAFFDDLMRNKMLIFREHQ